MKRSLFVLLKGKIRVALADVVRHSCAFLQSMLLIRFEHSSAFLSFLCFYSKKPPEDFPTWLLQTLTSARDVTGLSHFCSFMSASLAVLTCVLYKSLTTTLSLSLSLLYTHMPSNKNQLTSRQSLLLFQSDQLYFLWHTWTVVVLCAHSGSDFLTLTFFLWAKNLNCNSEIYIGSDHFWFWIICVGVFGVFCWVFDLESLPSKTTWHSAIFSTAIEEMVLVQMNYIWFAIWCIVCNLDL